MDEKFTFLIFYLGFLSIWACIALAVSKGLKWVGRHYIDLSNSNNEKRASLKDKLIVYLTFQIILILSVVLFRKMYMALIVLFFSIALIELICRIVNSRLEYTNKIISITAGMIVSGVSSICFIHLYSLINYKIFVYALFVLAAADSFSQVVGESLKGPRLFPKISPGKTWSGLIGGFIFSIFGALSFYFLFTPGSSVKFILISTCIIFICGFAGDAGISALKRWIGIKDFSNIMGAQGGMLDRIDSMILLGPVASILFTFYRV